MTSAAFTKLLLGIMRSAPDPLDPEEETPRLTYAPGAPVERMPKRAEQLLQSGIKVIF